MTIPLALRCFWVLLRPRRSELLVAAVLLAYAAYIAWTVPRDLDQVFVLALFLQMFWAARGFREPARRGHYDPILIATPRRARIARAHWVASVVPGLVVWLVLAVLVFVVRPAEWPWPLEPSPLVALGVVSCAAWAISLPLVRYSTGVIWMTTLFALAGGGYLTALRTSFLESSHGWLATLRAAAAAFVCPVILLTDHPPVPPWLLALLAALAVACVTAGHAYIARLDVPLGDPS